MIMDKVIPVIIFLVTFIAVTFIMKFFSRH